MFLILSSLICVAFLTLLERKILGLIGYRPGPNKVSYAGILQPIGDAVKLGNKSYNTLSFFSFNFYYLSSVIMLCSSMLLFGCLGSCPNFISIKFSILFFFLVLGLNSLNSVYVGWSVFSKFSLIGSVRSVSQLISYEAALYVCMFFFILFYNLYDFSSITFYFLGGVFFCFFPCFYFWFPIVLAELNRTPYDFSESESELVSGFNTEFGSSCFTLIFLAEYSSMVFFSILSLFLFSNFFPPLLIFFFFFFIWIRSVLPRFRFDKLMSLSWKFFIPVLTLFFLLCFFIFSF